MQRADLQLLVNQRKPTCVLDPALVLCQPRGPWLATRLSQVMEPWLTRSFWQALDSSDLLARGGVTDGDAGVSGAALSGWITMREGSELGASIFRWIGDRLPESLMQESGDQRTFDRYEALAEALDQRCERRAPAPSAWGLRFDAEAASRDALVMSATLDGALVLTAQTGAAPPPVQAARSAGMEVSQVGPDCSASLFVDERAFVRRALAMAGLAPWLEKGPPLAAVHVVLDDTDGPSDDLAAEPWARACVWWYVV